jgi:uncharacterized membrane protein
MKILFYRFNNLGTKPFCNLDSESAPHIGNWCFPLCWRCLSIILSYYLSKYIFLPIFFIKHSADFILSFSLILPCIVDGILRYKYNSPSSTYTRIITGILAGIGISLFLFQM